jgi:hypothetical protein
VKLPCPLLNWNISPYPRQCMILFPWKRY